MKFVDGIVSKTQTCSACPSQWEGVLTDGRMFYVRFRHGYLSIRVSNSITEDAYDAVSGEEIFGVNSGDDMDGSCDWTWVEQQAKDLWVKE